MTSETLMQSMDDLIQTAVALANSVKEDIKEQRSISDGTVLILSEFRRRHDELNDVLDLINGVN